MIVTRKYILYIFIYLCYSYQNTFIIGDNNILENNIIINCDSIDDFDQNLIYNQITLDIQTCSQSLYLKAKLVIINNFISVPNNSEVLTSILPSIFSKINLLTNNAHNGSYGSSGGSGGSRIHNAENRAENGHNGTNGVNGANGGGIMSKGGAGGAGGNGGNGGRGGQLHCTFWNKNNPDEFNFEKGGVGGDGGDGGNGAGYLIIEADEIINNGIIQLKGGDGFIGGTAGDGDGGHEIERNGVTTHSGYSGVTGRGGRGRKYSKNEAGNGDAPYERGYNGGGGGGGATVDGTTCVAGGGGGGQGGKGGGGAGGGGGVVIFKSPKIINNGSINLQGGNPGEPSIQGATGGNGGNGASQIDGGKPKAFGGGGGGGGGQGGNGGKGSDGIVFFIHGNHSYIKGSIVGHFENIQDATYLNIIDDLNASSVVWHNLQKFNNSEKFILFNNLKINYTNQYDTFGIKKVLYNIHSNCKTFGQKVWPQSLSNFANSYNDVTKVVTPLDGLSYLWQKSNITIKSNNVPNLFSLCDGINYLNITAINTNGNQTNLQKPIFIDQYAPCDEPNQHACDIEFTDISNNIIKLGTNSNTFKINIKAVESVGSGVDNTSTSLYIFKQINNITSPFYNYNDHKSIVNLKSNIFNKTCEEIITQKLWGQNIIPIHLSSTTTEVTLEDINNTDDTTTKATIDGTYWFIACLKDMAGNSSFIINPQELNSIKNNLTTHNYTGLLYGNNFNLSMFNPSGFLNNFNYDNNLNNQIQNVYIPSLYKRLIIDTPIVDTNENSCSTDPCASLPLDPPPIHFSTESNVLQIAYDPPLYTNTNILRVGIKLPYDQSGIEGVYYKLSNLPPQETDVLINKFIPRDLTSLEKCTSLVKTHNDKDNGNRFINISSTSKNWVDFCFDIVPVENTNLYIWLKDNAGNQNFQTAFVQRKIYVDKLIPTAPTNLKINPNPSLSNQIKLTFDSSKDDKQIEYHQVCIWKSYVSFNDIQLNKIEKGTCPKLEQVFTNHIYKSPIILLNEGQSKIEYQSNFNLPYGKFSFTSFGVDIAGNVSPFSNIYNLLISDGKSRLDFLINESNYNTGIYPQKGTSGYYHFKINYSDVENRAPKSHQIWIDQNNNNTYDLDEKFNMSQEINDMNQEQIDTYVNGVTFTSTIYLKYQNNTSYQPDTKPGFIKFKFVFINETGQAIDGIEEGDPTKDNSIILDPYDLNSFDGLMQIRNNLVNNTSINKPTILLKAPFNDINSKINVNIYSKQHIMIRKLLNNIKYSEIDRYFIWDLKDDTNNIVPNGLYWVQYESNNITLSIDKIIINQ